jgi:hypothetical protein
MSWLQNYMLMMPKSAVSRYEPESLGCWTSQIPCAKSVHVNAWAGFQPPNGVLASVLQLLRGQLHCLLISSLLLCCCFNRVRARSGQNFSSVTPPSSNWDKSGFIQVSRREYLSTWNPGWRLLVSPEEVAWIFSFD